ASLVLGVGMAQARSGSIRSAVARGLGAPMSIAGAIALIINLADLDVPLVADRSIGLLAQALIPVMLFGLGLQLVAAGRPQWSGELGVVVVAKLLVAPATAAMVAVAVGLEGDARSAVIIQSAMPPAVFCAVVAAENDLLPGRVTAAVVVTTVIWVLTLPVVLVAL
ncbi:MAG: AEC family transporter, partial [Actinomycetota bacterium]